MNQDSEARGSEIKVSVVVPVHNGATWIHETLNSICSQSMTNLEVVLVDDASTDNLLGVLKEYSDPRINVYHMDQNVGVSAARNFGIDKARGQYIAFCDSDDLCMPNRMAIQLNYLEMHPEIDVCGSAFTLFDREDLITVSHPISHEEIGVALLRGNCFGLSTVMARRSVFELRKFDPNLSVSEDYDLWTRLVLSGYKVSNLEDVLVKYRIHSHQLSHRKAQKLDYAARRIRAHYCASTLGDDEWVSKIVSGKIDWNDLTFAAKLIKELVKKKPYYTAQDFRFFLAWLYQQQLDHGLKSCYKWQMLQKKLDLKLDLKYRFNVWLLAMIPIAKSGYFYDILLKLKR